MSRYPPSDYRGARERSRSPPRFSDRRGSTASIFDNRASGPPRTASDAPRGPRSQFDARPPLSSTLGSGPGPRPGYSSLRDAPPLGSGPDRGRPFRERDYDRRDRSPPPRERSPPRNFKDTRDYPPRDVDSVRPRRGSRDGPISASSTYSDAPPFSAASGRGGFARGRGRGDFEFRAGRGGRRNVDDRDLFRRDRSPPARWGRDLSREDRDADRRDERRFDRREDERRSDWADRERDRERDIDRTRRDQQPPPLRPDSRPQLDTSSNPTTPYPASPAVPIDPGRLALIESTTGDAARRPPASQPAPAATARRDVPETPAYLNGRAETTANRYNQRGSSPPLQAPPVPAFSFAPSAPAAASAGGGGSPPAPKSAPDPTIAPESAPKGPSEDNAASQSRPVDPPTAPKAALSAQKTQFADPPPTAPRAPRALEHEAPTGPGSRLQGSRSFENINASANPSSQPLHGSPPTAPSAMSPRSHGSFPTLIQPVSPNVRPMARPTDPVAPPTGPRASRMSSGQPSPSPRMSQNPSPRLDMGGMPGFSGVSRGHTPPPTAPSGPRHGSFSVSPKVTSSMIPTAPKADRAPPVVPRAAERGGHAPGRPADRNSTAAPWAAPTAPRSQTQPWGPQNWNPWRRQGAPGFTEQTVPAKRDSTGEEKERQPEQHVSRHPRRAGSNVSNSAEDIKMEDGRRHSIDDKMDVDTERHQPRTSSISNHSARQSFFGKPVESTEGETGLSDAVDEATSSSEDEELNAEEDVALFNAKYERQKRALESNIIDLSAREYRATTPLESIARLARISAKDLQRVTESREMEVDQLPATSSRLPAAAAHTSESDDGPEVATPKGEDEARIAIHGSDDSMENVRQIRRPTPEVISLPHLTKDPQPFHESQVFLDSLKRHEESLSAVRMALQNEVKTEDYTSEQLERDFARHYRIWREECEIMDREREEQERLEREQSFEPGPDPDAPASLTGGVGGESRRALKYNSEYDFELAIKQSEETARLEQERQERELKKVQADLEKEALLPDQMTEREFITSMFVDTNRLRDPETLTQVFSYEPPADTFTENEQQIFIAAYKETPKKWGEIASLLPGRDYKDCIHHYYANKWDNRFRDNRTKRFKGRGRGRGGKTALRAGRGSALMADLSRGEEITQSVSDSGRPKRAAAPTTFGEKDPEAKAALLGTSPSKRGAKNNDNSESGPEKPGKRRKGTGEKPGRKPKVAQALAPLAAAPTASPVKVPGGAVHSKEDLARAQNLEDASLLASLQGGHHVFQADTQSVYAPEPYGQARGTPSDGTQRSKPTATASSAKPNASSYWSVPEQTDFAKYIAHFGTDFAAIAAHMGTKTQTMIKNHYMRQIDGGNRAELEHSARVANKRREMGQDMGAPPTPTPIVKRKYDNPQPVTQRALAPHKDAMDVDEPRPQTAKHASPPHYQNQGRFTTAAPQAGSIPTQRVAPSPVPTAVTPIISQAQPVSSRPGQHPLGSQIAFMADVGPDPARSAMQSSSGFRASQDSPSHGLSRQSSQSGRPVSHQPNQEYIVSLQQEQQRAFLMQQAQSQQDRIDQLQRQPTGPMHRGSTHGSPVSQPLQHPSDRMHFKEERPASPPRNAYSPGMSRGLSNPSGYNMPGSTPFSSSGPTRPPFATSPPRREEPRLVAPSQAPVTSAPTPAPEPKRSNLFGILNSDPEPAPPKREVPPNPPQRTESPGPQRYANSPTPLSASINPPLRRDNSFGQTSVPKSSLHRMSFAPSTQTSASTPLSAPKHESQGPGSGAPGQKLDWTTQVYRQPGQSRPPSPPAERPYYSSHRGFTTPLSQPPANPSPPPHTVVGHSRTPSLTMNSGVPSRKPHPTLQNPSRQPTPQQSLPPNAYGQPPSGPPYHQPPTSQAQNHSHHAHNSSLGSYTSMHHRGISRDDQARQQEEQMYAQRQRDEGRQWERREMEAAERRERDAQQQYHAQRQEHERQQSFGRSAPPKQPLHQQYGAPSFSRGGMPSLGGLREQSRAETEHHVRVQEEQRRAQQDADQRRHHDTIMREREQEDHRRRHEAESMYRNRTPLGGNGGYGPPPPARR